MEGCTDPNKFELQGKEKEMTFNLTRINFGARVYNPTIGRFDRIDNLSEKFYDHSPYIFTLNNPINVIDPDGNDAIRIEGGMRYTGDDVKDVFEIVRSMAQNNGGDDKDKKSKPTVTEKEARQEMAVKAKGEGGMSFLSFAFSVEGLFFLVDQLYGSFGSGELSENSNPVLKAQDMVAHYAMGKLAGSSALLATKIVGDLKNVKLISSNLLKKQGLDAHAIKTEFLGPKNISKYDLYKHSNTGEILIFGKEGKETPISTGYFIK